MTTKKTTKKSARKSARKRPKRKAAQPNKGGRPSIFSSPRRQARIVRALRQGAHYATAAKIAGVHSDTLRRWLKRGEEAGIEATGEDRQYFRFYAVCEKALALDERDRLRNIKIAGQNGDWHADAWHLERRYRKNYSRQIQVAGQDGGPIEVIQRDINDEDRTSRLQRVMELAQITPRGARRMVVKSKP